MILLIDNYDSFAHNLARYLRQLGQTVQVVRNDQISIDDIRVLRPSAIVISPGPCTPDQAGISLPVVTKFSDHIPILGVCLGHQVICQALGNEIVRVTPTHGCSSEMIHTGHPLFNGIPSPFVVGRYHSLVAMPDTIPDQLEVIATTENGIVMAVAHREFPLVGVQFHPESILTECGYRLLANFLGLAKIAIEDDLVATLAERFARQTETPILRRSPARASITPHPY